MQQLFLYATLMSEILIKSYIIEIGKNKFSRIKYTSIVKSARSWHWNSHEKSFCQSNKEIKQLYNSWVNRSNNVMMDYFPHKDCGLPQDLCVPICIIKKYGFRKHWSLKVNWYPRAVIYEVQIVQLYIVNVWAEDISPHLI